MTLYTVHLIDADGTARTTTVRAATVDVAEAVALAEADLRWPGRGWLVSHVEADDER